MSDRVKVIEKNFAFQNRLHTFSVVNENHTDIRDFFEDAYKHFKSRVTSFVEMHYLIKVGASFVANFEKIILTEQGVNKKETQKMYLSTAAEILDFESDLSAFYSDNIVSTINRKIDDVELRGSGFSLAEILELNIQISSFDPYSGSSYIPLPKILNRKRAIINVKNEDDQCFKYAVLSALFPVNRNPQRINNYIEHADKLDFTNITFPIGLKEITKFELQNPLISINVYMYDYSSKKIRPLRLCKVVKEKHIHLLMLTEQSDNLPDEKSHYCWIKNLSALLGDQVTMNCGKKYFCDRCLNHFHKEEKLRMHTIQCSIQNELQIQMPTFANNIIEFKNHRNQLKAPFIIYADLESILKKPDIKFSESETTVAYQQHQTHSIGYFFKCMYDESQSYYRTKRGEHCIEWFVQELYQIAQIVDEILNKPEPLNMTMEDEVLFIMSDECHICGRAFMEDEIKVRDHSHITGEFRGAAHQKCNLSYQEVHHIPIVFHNLSNYDAHFFISALAKNIPGQISVIPCTDQQYISFTKTVPSNRTDKFAKFIQLRFIDSFRFMTSSLDYLSSLLPSCDKNVLRSQYKHLTEEQMQLLQRKGVFCYDYIDSWSKLDETSLPSKEQFYNNLTESHISDEDYQFANKVWNEFNIKTLGEYSDLYMKTDILLLADVFEHFRETCYSIYKLDPAHYYTAPGLSFDAMLKYTQVRIELLTDVDMLLFVERGIRGGISQCSKRYSKANNKYMKHEYDPNRESKYLMYLDANNLYGYSMMQHLPIDNFQWCQDEFTAASVLEIPDESPTGYILEVDLDYPKELHDLHKDYPFCPENRIVPQTRNEKKLLLTLFNKRNYVIHYKMLKSALQQGLILKNVHKVLKFSQSQWLKPYIMLNTSLRTNATNDFEKNFYKLLINAIYGKTMENVRSRVDIKLKSSWNGRYGARKLVAQPNFKRYTIFDENLVAIHLNHTHILMNKPIIIGMSILDLSKVLMYNFYYNHIKRKYGQNVEMVYTDTDSFILEVVTDCFYTDMLQNLDKYDTSDYSENNIFNLPRVNKKVPGLFKDELNGDIMTEFVGLRSKMYCVKSRGVEKMKKAKGVKKYVLKKSITFEDYMRCIHQNCTVIREQHSIRSKKHTVFTVKQSKIALSAMDNKRFILEGNIRTLPWGHFEVSPIKRLEE